jgi:type IV pilus assembly protein PilV
MSWVKLRRQRLRSDGFALLEALVALSVLAVGLLGSMALLLAGLRSSREAQHHGAAARLAGDLGERMRANRAAMAAYVFDSTTAPAADVPACGVGAGCLPDDRARADVAEWRQELVATLPQAAARLRLDDAGTATGAMYTIELSWGGSGLSGGGSYALRLRARAE